VKEFKLLGLAHTVVVVGGGIVIIASPDNSQDVSKITPANSQDNVVLAVVVVEEVEEVVGFTGGILFAVPTNA
jgi:hypothetical protein